MGRSQAYVSASGRNTATYHCFSWGNVLVFVNRCLNIALPRGKGGVDR